MKSLLMKSLLSICLLSSLLSLPAAAAHRVAVIVGANQGAEGRQTLRYSLSDARELADVLTAAGEFKEGDIHLLLEPEPAAVLTQLDSLLEAAGHSNEETLLLFYYSGHADDRALYPKGEALLFDDLHKRLSDGRAAVRIGIIDACRGGAWTRAKGLTPEAPFAVNVPLDVASEGSVLLASSSGEESAHETDSLRGSFFTHHLVAGLRGAADSTGSGQVTLTEAFAYAQRYTIRDTSRASIEPQHPSFDTQLHGRSDIVLTRAETSPSVLSLEQKEGPLQLVQPSTGVVLLEAPPGERTLKLAVPPGAYLVRKLQDGKSWSKEILVEAGKPLTVPEVSLVLTGASVWIDKGPSAMPHLTCAQGRFCAQGVLGETQTQEPAPSLPFLQNGPGTLVSATTAVTGTFGLQYGLTDRLQLDLLLPGLAYRFGDPHDGGDYEFVPHAGLNSLLFSHQGPATDSNGNPTPGGTSIRYGLVGDLFARQWWFLNTTANWQLGITSTGLLGARVSSTFEPALHGPDRWSAFIGVGFSHFWWSNNLGGPVSVNFGLTEENLFSFGASRGYTSPERIISFGSVLTEAGRRLPLLQLALGKNLTGDLYGSFGFGTSGARTDSTGVGLTLSF